MGKRIHFVRVQAVEIFLWLKRLFVALLLINIALVLYEVLLEGLFTSGNFLPHFLALWLLTAYIVLPRVHRFLSRIYLPNYFIGRVRTGDGMLGDPINLAVIGSEEKLIAALESAGWVQADPLTWRSTLRMIKRTVLHQSYPNAPFSSLWLFNRPQDLAFQKEFGGNPHKRHHVRFWRTPTGWWLPGGYKADWLGAATFDRGIGFSFFTGQITHRIAERTDEERDFTAHSIELTGLAETVKVVKHFTSAYHDRNGGGDRIETDGHLPFITLKTSQ